MGKFSRCGISETIQHFLLHCQKISGRNLFIFIIWYERILVHTPNQLVAVMHHIVVCQLPKNDKEEEPAAAAEEEEKEREAFYLRKSKMAKHHPDLIFCRKQAGVGKFGLILRFSIRHSGFCCSLEVPCCCFVGHSVSIHANMAWISLKMC